MPYQPLYLDITGTLTAESPFHIGTGESWNPATDNPLARRDGSQGGAFVLPGSSLRGVLRAHLRRECRLLGCSQEDVARLFGSASGTEGKQGWLTILDAVATTPESPRELRDHVRINRESGAAESKAKFDEEVGLSSTEFSFHCIYEGEEDPACMRLLDGAVRALSEGRIRVGAGSGRGYGRIKLTEKSCRGFRRHDALDLQSFFSYRIDPKNVSPVAWPGHLDIQPASPLPDENGISTVTIGIRIECEGPVLVRSSVPPVDQASHADAAFFYSQKKKVLPGSSLRGICRSRAEKICLSAGWDVSRMEELFGSAKQDSSGRRGLLEFSDAEAISGQDVYLDHVAIDRITGFAAKGKKFAAIALASPVFTGTITVRYGPSSAGALTLWTLVLRDLIEGYRMWIGSGTTRGYGKIIRAAVTEITGWRATLEGRKELKTEKSATPGGFEITELISVFGLNQ